MTILENVGQQNMVLGWDLMLGSLIQMPYPSYNLGYHFKHIMATITP
jgi:hypothetical protein